LFFGTELMSSAVKLLSFMTKIMSAGTKLMSFGAARSTKPDGAAPHYFVRTSIR
jgi:hypothetical protein